jgi:branched-chain amino acid transport system substrate-binding protein
MRGGRERWAYDVFFSTLASLQQTVPSDLGIAPPGSLDGKKAPGQIPESADHLLKAVSDLLRPRAIAQDEIHFRLTSNASKGYSSRHFRGAMDASSPAEFFASRPIKSEKEPMNSIARRIGIVLSIFVVLASVPFAFGKDEKPIKIGFISSYVGAFAKPGKDMDNGFRLALEEAGYKAAGRPIVFIPEDDETKPENGPTKARKLIENDKVDIIAGLDHSGIALSIRDIVVNNKIPTVITTAGEPSLTGKLKSPYIFRVSWANMQRDLPAGWYAYNKLGFKRAILIAPDYSAGRDTAEGFKKYFVASGGQVVEELYPPINTTDFGPYITKMMADKTADFVWAFFPPGGCIRLINQYDEFGLKAKLPMFVIGDTIDDAVLPSMKDAALGIKSYSQYANTLPSPENESFVKAYLAKYKDYPSIYSEGAYVGAKAIIMALNAVKGHVENKDAFLAALRKVKFNAPRGPFSFDANQNVVLTMYLREVKKVEGRYANVVTATIAKDVDQDWTPAKMKK